MQLWQLIDSNPTPVCRKEGERARTRSEEATQERRRRRTLERREPAEVALGSRHPALPHFRKHGDLRGNSFLQGTLEAALRHTVANPNPARGRR
jgi:hypothetical protein